MTAFRVGETVDITIRGAKVEKTTSDPLIHVALPNGFRVMVDPTSDAVTVERTQPPEWPPQLGDVWLDRNGEPWFCARSIGQYLFFYNANGHDKDIADVAKDHGPLTLALRIGVDEVAS